MPLEAATFLDGLVSTNPPGSDELKQADDHLRLIKAVLKATFPSLTRAMYLEKARADVADSATPALWAATTNYANLLGTTTITGFASGTDGQWKIVRFAGVRQLTHHASTLALPGGANITTAAGDHALVQCLGTTNNVVLAYFRADGSALVDLTPAATESVAGTVEQATDAEIRSAATGAKAIMAQDLETAAAFVGLSDGATVAVDWDTGINFSVTVAGNRTIGNPSNGQPGTSRTIFVAGNDGTQRTLSWGNQFGGELPALTDITSTRTYLLTIFCINATYFIASAKRAGA